MRQVKVSRSGVGIDEVAEVLRSSLGPQYRVEINGDSLIAQRGPLSRAKVTTRPDQAGTLFEIRGEGAPMPLLYFTLRTLNERGIALRVAEAIQQAEVLHGNG